MNGIRKYIDAHRDEMIALLRELVAVRSVQGKAEPGYPFGREPARALDIMLRRCSEYGLAVENVENYAGSADLGTDPQLAVLSHLDVVPEGKGWTSDPYTLREEDGRLFGRGTIDDKGPAVAALFAVRAVKELGIPLKKGVRLIFGTNEENGSADLEYYRSKRDLPPMVFTPDGEYPVINAEKGMLRVYFSAHMGESGKQISGGTVINAVPSECTCFYAAGGNRSAGVCHSSSGQNIAPEVSENMEIFRGVSAHASAPEKGENAITKFLAFHKGEDEILTALAELFPHGETDGRSCGLGFRDEVSGDMTCVLSMLNTDDRDTLHGAVDIRFPLDRTKAGISSIICGKLEDAGFTVDSCEGVEPHCTDGDSEFVKSLLSAYTEVTGDAGRCIAIGGGTYVHEIEGGVAFGAEFPGEDCNMHSPDEFITVENLLKNAEIMAEAIVRVCG